MKLWEFLLILAVLWSVMLCGLVLGKSKIEGDCIYKNEIVTTQGTYLCIKKHELKEEIK